MEMAEMNGQMTNAIQIILLLLGSILMLITGFCFISSKYAIFAGVVCFIVSVFTEGIFRKIINIEGILRWKSHKNTEHK
jgi:membrane protein YdbS with pleckstrin-like domain